MWEDFISRIATDKVVGLGSRSFPVKLAGEAFACAVLKRQLKGDLNHGLETDVTSYLRKIQQRSWFEGQNDDVDEMPSDAELPNDASDNDTADEGQAAAAAGDGAGSDNE